jgi:hypothetical protein
VIATLIARLVALGCPPGLAKPLLGIVAALVILGALWGGKCAYDRSVIDKHETQLQQRAAPATDKASTERANDTIATAKHEQELHDVIQAQPDQPISPTSHALACKRLSDAGKHPPACR